MAGIHTILPRIPNHNKRSNPRHHRLIFFSFNPFGAMDTADVVYRGIKEAQKKRIPSGRRFFFFTGWCGIKEKMSRQRLERQKAKRFPPTNDLCWCEPSRKESNGREIKEGWSACVCIQRMEISPEELMDVFSSSKEEKAVQQFLFAPKDKRKNSRSRL